MGLFGLFRKKTTVKANENDRQVIEEFAAKVDVLLAIAPNEICVEKLREFREKVEYLSVSPKSDVLKLDKKISDALDDLKILLSKHKKDKKIIRQSNKAIKNIEILVAQRAIIY